MLLPDKVALVTGTATGIGESIARHFAAEGAKVFLLDRDERLNEEVANSLAREYGFAQAMTGDVRDGKAMAAFAQSAIDKFRRIDILINNAGIYPRQNFLEMTEAQWDEIQDINLKSMFWTSRAVLPHMVKAGSGKVVNISSVTFHMGPARLAHYVASKGGVIGLTRALAREMGEHNIHINCITPGAVLVEAEKAVATPEQVQAVVDLQSLKRRIMPDDIARVCTFLCSSLSDGMTGQTLNVDGGWIMY